MFWKWIWGNGSLDLNNGYMPPPLGCILQQQLWDFCLLLAGSPAVFPSMLALAHMVSSVIANCKSYSVLPISKWQHPTGLCNSIIQMAPLLRGPEWMVLSNHEPICGVCRFCCYCPLPIWKYSGKGIAKRVKPGNFWVTEVERWRYWTGNRAPKLRDTEKWKSSKQSTFQFCLAEWFYWLESPNPFYSRANVLKILLSFDQNEGAIFWLWFRSSWGNQWSNQNNSSHISGVLES